MNLNSRLSQNRLKWSLPLILAILVVLIHVLRINEYGIFRDELYYLACAEHPAAGYVDQPPLAPLLLRGIVAIFGDSLAAIRTLPALSHGLFILFAAFLAFELGGGWFAGWLAASAMAATPGNNVLFHFFSMNFIDFILWQVILWLILRAVKTRNSKYWITLGLIAGIGLLNKISVLYLGAGLGVGLLLTRERRQLLWPKLWLGVGIALLLFSPYLIWNAINDWAVLEFIHNARTYKMADVSPLGFFMGQLLYNNPLNILIWGAGLIFFLLHPGGREYRIFGVFFLFLFILFIIQQAKDYYLAPAYPILFAGGAVFWEILSRKRVRYLRFVLPALIISGGIVMTPITLPVLSVSRTIEIMRNIGFVPPSGEKSKVSVLPQHYADMFGWKEMTRDIAAAYDVLSSQEQQDCMILTRNYGEAGAVDYFGDQWNLPPASSGHNNYWLWGPPDWNGTAAVILGPHHDVESSRNELQSYFETVELVVIHTCEYSMPFENHLPVFVCRTAKMDIEDLWPTLKHYI